MHFEATRRWKMTDDGPTNKRKSSSVGLAQSRRKLLPTDTQKFFRAISDCECSACPRSLLTDIIYSCLLHLQPAAANSRFWPPCSWPSSCSTLPLSSPLQLRVPLPPPSVAFVPGVPSRTRSAMPPPCSCRRPRTAPVAAISSYHRLRPVPSGTHAIRRRRCASPSLSKRVLPPLLYVTAAAPVAAIALT
jgi:hypothetical protein